MKTASKMFTKIYWEWNVILYEHTMWSQRAYIMNLIYGVTGAEYANPIYGKDISYLPV